MFDTTKSCPRPSMCGCPGAAARLARAGWSCLTLTLCLVITVSEVPPALAEIKPEVEGKSASAAKPLIGTIPGFFTQSNEKFIDAEEFIHNMADAADALDAYSFKYETDVYKGSKVINQSGNFFFKKPRLILVQMTGEYKHGAEAALGADGKVRAHMGGVLKSFTVTVDPNSDLLQGANGYPLVDSDFASMSRVVKGFLKQGMKAHVSDQAVHVDGLPNKVYVLEVYNSAANNELYKRAYIDAHSMLPVQWFDYQGARVFARTTWTNLKTNLDLKDDFFKI